MSEHFDSYQLGPGEYLWFDTNLAHLGWLRDRVTPGGPTVGVTSSDGVYRPVGDVQALIRDEFIAPSLGLHLAVPVDDLAETWAQVAELCVEIAEAVGVPSLVVERTAPAHYAHRAVGAVLPSTRGELEPWLLAYELGPAFQAALGVPGRRVLEVGISSRILAFAAQLQSGSGAVFGSRVTPAQLAVDLRRGGTEPVLAGADGLRVAAMREAPDRPSTLTGLAPVLLDPDRKTYRCLLDDYREERPWDGADPAGLVAIADRRLRTTRDALLAERLAHGYELLAPGPGAAAQRSAPEPGTVLRAAPGVVPPGTRLRPRPPR
jgi:hypothetical protein